VSSVPAIQGEVVLVDETDRLLEALEPIIERYKGTKRDGRQDLIRAVRLSPSLQVCEALLHGEPVPKSRLDPNWARAYGIR
jgi:hypothetical protein